MSIYDFELDVDGNENYVCPTDEIHHADELHALDGPGFTVVELREAGIRLAGLRLDAEVMDKLAKWWIDHRRVCPFCKEPGMDVTADETENFGDVETSWNCRECGALQETQFISGDVPWEDPLADTRTADEDVHRRSGIA